MRRKSDTPKHKQACTNIIGTVPSKDSPSPPPAFSRPPSLPPLWVALFVHVCGCEIERHRRGGYRVEGAFNPNTSTSTINNNTDAPSAEMAQAASAAAALGEMGKSSFVCSALMVLTCSVWVGLWIVGCLGVVARWGEDAKASFTSTPADP